MLPTGLRPPPQMLILLLTRPRTGSVRDGSGPQKETSHHVHPTRPHAPESRVTCGGGVSVAPSRTGNRAHSHPVWQQVHQPRDQRTLGVGLHGWSSLRDSGQRVATLTISSVKLYGNPRHDDA